MANIYKKAKTEIGILAVMGMILFISSAVLNDFISATQGIHLYTLIALKWIVVIALLGLMVLKILKIINVTISNPLSIQKTVQQKRVTLGQEKFNAKKEHIMQKTTLLTESDMIIQKYTKEL
jgi:hypothetical protein